MEDTKRRKGKRALTPEDAERRRAARARRKALKEQTGSAEERREKEERRKKNRARSVRRAKKKRHQQIAIRMIGLSVVAALLSVILFFVIKGNVRGGKEQGNIKAGEETGHAAGEQALEARRASIAEARKL